MWKFVGSCHRYSNISFYSKLATTWNIHFDKLRIQSEKLRCCKNATAIYPYSYI